MAFKATEDYENLAERLFHKANETTFKLYGTQYSETWNGLTANGHRFWTALAAAAIEYLAANKKDNWATQGGTVSRSEIEASRGTAPRERGKSEFGLW